MQELLDAASYMAHGYCLLWQPWLIALHAIPDAVIFVSYTSIPLALLWFLRLRPELKEYRLLVSLFAAFILLCGLTHLLGLITLWYPIYFVQGLAKAATAAVSFATAVALFPLVPKLAAIPSPRDLEETNARLVAEAESHRATLDELRAIRKRLEVSVSDRTAELEATNARLETLTRETVHRSKNLLTVVRSLSRQTARTSRDIDDFVAKLIGRLDALDAATDLVVAGGAARSADLRAVVDAQLAAYSDSFAERLRVEGPPLALRTEAAQQISLLVHELATNALKYGGLASDGRVEISWRVDGDNLVFDWRETGATALREAERTGFGTQLVTRAVPMQLGGHAVRQFLPEGLFYRLTVALGELAPRDRTRSLSDTAAAFGNDAQTP